MTLKSRQRYKRIKAVENQSGFVKVFLWKELLSAVKVTYFSNERGKGLSLLPSPLACREEFQLDHLESF
jgi:hypothetical protein